ncbi:hypothetical protein [Thalassospira povalilytica]|uniref:hypothetical protein n=1 Tax=Thalassospira TaxID=168934 RepID=UPI001D1839AF|nr:hypothetical protein [Thalassospira povalilytica]MCC4242106.1 hypothetical protein [Thalassospira povalilytica]
MIDPIGCWHQATKPALAALIDRKRQRHSEINDINMLNHAIGAQALDIAIHLAGDRTDDVLISA